MIGNLEAVAAAIERERKRMVEQVAKGIIAARVFPGVDKGVRCVAECVAEELELEEADAAAFVERCCG